MRAYLFKSQYPILTLLLLCILGLPGQYALAGEPNTIDEPKITIRQEEKKTFYEYRINGELKEIKVVPQFGPVYYLVPASGDTWIREDESQFLVPSWVIFEW